MKQHTLYLAIFVLGGLSLATGAVMAQQQQRPPPPEPDFAAISSKLGVPESAIQSCMGERSKNGQKPSDGQRPGKPDASKISSCLNNAGYKVSEASTDAALAAGAPKRK